MVVVGGRRKRQEESGVPFFEIRTKEEEQLVRGTMTKSIFNTLHWKSCEPADENTQASADQWV